MKIERVEVFIYRVPPRQPIADSTWEIKNVGYTIVRISTDDGLSGIGITFEFAGEAVRLVVEDFLAPLVMGHSPFEAEAL